MATLSVVVFKHGKAQPQATVQLNGPSGTKSLTTNVAGAVSFEGLAAGRYIVNAAHLADFLGNGFMTLTTNQTGVIHIKFPKVTAAPKGTTKPASLSVRTVIYYSGTPTWPNYAKVELSGPSSRSADAGMGTAKFSDLEPGDYSISVKAVAAGGMQVAGNAAVRLIAGETSSIEVPLFTGTSINEPCGYDVMTSDEILKRIGGLEGEIAHLEARALRLGGADTQYHYDCLRRGKKIEHLGDGYKNRFNDGSAMDCVSRFVVNQSREDRYISTINEIRGKQAIVNALKEALECQKKNPSNNAIPDPVEPQFVDATQGSPSGKRY